MRTMYGWIFGYDDANDADDEKEEKSTEEKEDLDDIPPPPPLVRQNGIHKGNTGTIDTKITWANYDEEFKKVDKELAEMKKMLADLEVIVKKSHNTTEELAKIDIEWKNRLSPVEDVVELKTKKKRSKTKKKKNNV